jgi:nucleosome binding factor SPN SPT16 subunit
MKVGKKRKNMSDRESIEEENKQKILKQKINKEFYNFSKLVEEKSQKEFDLPYRELEFVGTPARSSINLCILFFL